MSENLSPVTAETSTAEDDDDNSKNKSKKKAIGAFLVETAPPKKKESFWSGDDKSGEKKPGLFGKRDASEVAAEAGDKAEAPKDAEAGEALNVTERQEAVQQLAAARSAEVAAEHDDGTESSAAELAAAAAFLAAAETLGDTEVAYEQVAAELASEESDIIDTGRLNEGEIDLHATSAETGENEEELDGNTTPTNPVIASGSTPPPIPPRPPSNDGGGGGSTPPPKPPAGGGTPGPAYGGGQPPYTGSNVPNLAPTATAEATVPLSEAIADERRALANGLIVGGIVGYLYGRRRGRIKTEKRLAPVQRKLEKQVKSLQTELLQKETAVRQQARTLGRERPQLAAQVTERLQRVSMRPERVALHKAIPPERIGHVLVAASAGAAAERLSTASKPPKVEAATAKKQAETMSRSELLALSETVKVDGTSLRKIYETQLVSEKGLRRIITEHLRGGNISRALKREIVEKQIDFERDPILRDKAYGEAVSGSGKSALNSLLTRAGVSEDKAGANIGGSANTSGKGKRKEQAEKAKKKQQAILDATLITVISLLAIVITALLLRNY
ncbi:hypothetical protein H7Y63_03135 [Polaromonas sp.]|nr:hypothetical protein [Candidatus Saccharibacteria bacterium]